MNVHASLLGLHQPGEGWLFRLGVGWKYLLMLTLSLPALILQAWPVTLGSLALTIALLASSGIGPARMLRIGWAMWLILGLLAVLAARLLTLTTPTPELMEALIVALRPLRFVGLNPERIALAVALMIRSIPYLLGLFDEARDAARARGAERNVVALLMPMVLGSVAHAERTGEALAARGLGEREH